jgi:hypothetical protein
MSRPTCRVSTVTYVVNPDTYPEKIAGRCSRTVPVSHRALESLFGIMGDTIVCMAMTLRLADDETEALRRRAELEDRSMQEVARQAIREYVENHSRAELLDQVLDEELPRYAEALERLGR